MSTQFDNNPTGSGSEPLFIIDPVQVEALRNEAPGLLERLIPLFSETGEKAIGAMESAVAVGSCNGFANAAHLLKGCASNFGGQRLMAACQAICLAAREGDLDAFPKLLDEVRVEYQSAAEALQASR